MESNLSIVEAPTVDDIVAHALALKPAVAANFNSTESIALCTTRVYTKVKLTDGTTVDLLKKDNKYGAGYARVSSLSQRTAINGKGNAENEQKDGWSEQDQIQRIVNYFISKRQAFRLFSDCGLSGGLPYDDERLKEKMLRARVRRYEKMFERVFLSDLTIHKYTPPQVHGMRQHLADKKERILSGIADSDLEQDDLIQQQEVSDETSRGQRRVRFVVTFRPGLTVLIRNLPTIHTLAVTDLSRLSRSQALSAEIGEKIIEHKVSVEGLIENLDWMNSDEEIGNQLMALLIPKFAEYRLTEVLMNAMRGIVTMLEAGRPHGKLHGWLKRDTDGRAYIVEEKAKPIRRLIELFLSEDVLSTRQVALLLAKEGVHPPESTIWHRSTVMNTLRTEALVGKQEFFGMEWKVYEPLIDEATFDRIQKKISVLNEMYPNYAPKEGRNVTAYLLKCTCGSNLMFSKNSGGIKQIKCNCSPVKRRADPNYRHVTFSAKNVNEFIDELMMEHPRAVIDAFKESQERGTLLNELRQVENEVLQAKKRLRDRETAAKDEVRQNLLSMGIDETNILFGPTMVQLSAAKLVDTHTEIKRLEDAEREARFRLDTLVPQDVLTTLEQRVLAWNSLDAHQKNDIILTFFKEWRVEGEPPNEVVIPVLRNANNDTLFPIRLKTTNKKVLRRRFPTAHEYFASVQEGIGL